MPRIHFLNVLEGDCNIIQHDNGHITVMDVSNASNDDWTLQEKMVRNSIERQEMKNRDYVPVGKTNFHQKRTPDNPIEYLKKYGIKDIFRFIISHPDMDHLDGIRDLYQDFTVINTWDTNNDKELNGGTGGKYNSEDWDFYKNLRDGNYTSTKRLTLYSGNSGDHYSNDHLHILSPTPELVNLANAISDYNELSYAILYTPPKDGGGTWKILFAGDGCDDTWKHIITTHRDLVSDVDVLLAPHHGRGSDRDFSFLDVVNPRITLMGNASSTHLAYDKYPETRITNNQAGYVILDIFPNAINIFVKNKEFANTFRANPKRNWNETTYEPTVDAYFLGALFP
ncbi:MBL fold metallo-hydrolase [Chryseobacterium indologenes]|uniref:ComEC/Rec2 family competence protein n=1 Tax=Chryseobacterium TaxID=59732 RepID=UPI000BFB3109|nr:MBL fold metallo-hydrolase [Chryseobacterium indologenes]ATN04894.1 MBL fold metallo-hydrolase [Chryseobacterium indologenes]AYY86354.1 MBL fold metallo-hydrolase [Chryseobacterium indologenes]QIX83258.1 MBL fold metallo-hydrolase [Chryseobacterium indologenes]UDQ52943.1 hypothetical protein LJF28_16050 [Chryseobacterium indologenes]